MDSCYSGDHITGDHINSDAPTIARQPPQDGFLRARSQSTYLL